MKVLSRPPATSLCPSSLLPQAPPSRSRPPVSSLLPVVVTMFLISVFLGLETGIAAGWILSFALLIQDTAAAAPVRLRAYQWKAMHRTLILRTNTEGKPSCNHKSFWVARQRLRFLSVP